MARRFELTRGRQILWVVGTFDDAATGYRALLGLQRLQGLLETPNLRVIGRVALLRGSQVGTYGRDIGEIAGLSDQVRARLAELHAEQQLLLLGLQDLLLHRIEIVLHAIDLALVALRVLRQ